MTDRRSSEFEVLILPHLAAAYSLARWLMRHPQDAEDAVQDSMLRAYKAFASFAGGDGAAWLLAIVRNTCLTRLERRRSENNVVVLHDLLQPIEPARHSPLVSLPLAQDQAMIVEEERKRVHAAIAALPLQFREVLVLREFHDLAYREIAEVVGTPVGTVMSRLARARERMKILLTEGAAGDERGNRT
jgi:RNA polymerase sigma-70 factor (ECF subfamily)